MTKEMLTEVAAHWEKLAANEIEQAKWDREHGLDFSLSGHSPGDYRAESFLRTAKAIRLEIATGRAHCSICLGSHANHEHMHVG